jgi:GxxExxY protein
LENARKAHLIFPIIFTADGADDRRYRTRKPLMNAENVDLSQIVIGAAMKVLNTLRPGLDEKLCERALVIELRKQGVRCEQQKAHNVHYEGELIGTLVPDLIIGDRLIVDPKVVSDFNENHVAQMLGYLNITGLKTALLLNFKYAKLGIKRVSQST